MALLKKESIKKILVIKPSSLGDIFHCFPAVWLLRQAYPEAEIDWFVRPEFRDALAYCPVTLNKVINFPRKELGKLRSFLPAMKRTMRLLRVEKYDLVVDFQGLLRSAIFTSLARASLTAGFARPKEKISKYSYKVKVEVGADKVHAVDRNIALVEMLTGVQSDGRLPDLPEVKANGKGMAVILNKYGISKEDKILGIVTGARWESKCWAPEFFAGIAEKFIQQQPDYKVMLIGSPTDCEGAELILKQVNNPQLISIVGETSVGEMIEAIRRCEFILSNDSGPVHIAAALKKSVFGLFGPTSPEKTGPYGNFHHIFQRDLPCIKCLKRICPLNTYECHNLNKQEILNQLLEFSNKGANNEK
ncbi:MAG: lipopolysaccharide heptosyltransferase II [Lentisphaerae bacterium]|nr:lipopolysaccharide heptosyltransferase II [Lentisphaerota bacterium]MCP4101082.1 lipopolysaccharide heptosyltransferase II [Lentisphaerota bacterium]